jgi:predicted aspartyl protease
MSIQIGYLDSNGHPRLTIRINGTSPNTQADVEALIDTGFTGFLMLPIALALPLGLVHVGTGDYQLADGSKITNFLAKGTVTIQRPSVPPTPLVIPPGTVPLPPPPGTTIMQPEAVEGIIVLGGKGAILGMEFLRTLDKLLVVGKIVALLDNAVVAAQMGRSQ